MDASQYKDYVLVLLFVKYVSDKAASQKNYLLEVPKGGSFADMVALKGDKEIGDKMNKIIGKLAEANDLKGVIDVADFNDPKSSVKARTWWTASPTSWRSSTALDFRREPAKETASAMPTNTSCATSPPSRARARGKFYTPAEVSRIMAKVIGVGSAKRRTSQSVHDPTCGSAFAAFKAHDEAKSPTRLDLALYGQEMDNATAALATYEHDPPRLPHGGNLEGQHAR